MRQYNALISLLLMLPLGEYASAATAEDARKQTGNTKRPGAALDASDKELVPPAVPDLGARKAAEAAAGKALPDALGSPAAIESLQVLTGGYPRAFFFRSSEMMAASPGLSFEEWEKNFDRLMGIVGKALDEEIPGRSTRNLEFFTRFKRNHPQQLVMLHYNGNARSPLDHTEKYFAGHWLYFTGARILSEVPDTDGETEIRVSDAKLYFVNMGRYDTAKEDIGICELDASGKPDWNASEQVKLVSVDAGKGVIRVQRGQHGTRPRAFRAGRAYAAAHATEGPWGKSSPLLWNYNHATTCPRDRNGKNCNDILVEELVTHWPIPRRGLTPSTSPSSSLASNFAASREPPIRTLPPTAGLPWPGK